MFVMNEYRGEIWPLNLPEKQDERLYACGQPVCRACGENVDYTLTFGNVPGSRGLQLLPPHVCDPNQAMWEKWTKAFVKYDKEAK